MKGNAVIGVIVVGLLVAAGGGFVYMQQSDTGDQSSSNPTSLSTSSQANFYTTSSESVTQATGSDGTPSQERNNQSAGMNNSGEASNSSSLSAEEELAAWESAYSGNGSAVCDINAADVDLPFDIRDAVVYVDAGRLAFESTVNGQRRKQVLTPDGTIRWAVDSPSTSKITKGGRRYPG